MFRNAHTVIQQTSPGRVAQVVRASSPYTKVVGLIPSQGTPKNSIDVFLSLKRIQFKNNNNNSNRTNPHAPTTQNPPPLTLLPFALHLLLSLTEETLCGGSPPTLVSRRAPTVDGVHSPPPPLVYNFTYLYIQGVDRVLFSVY